jgi:hypothetical protein
VAPIVVIDEVFLAVADAVCLGTKIAEDCSLPLSDKVWKDVGGEPAINGMTVVLLEYGVCEHLFVL